MDLITSRDNAKIKYACRLREEEKLRAADGLFFAEGPKLCLELAKSCALRTLYATRRALDRTPELAEFDGRTVEITAPVAEKLAGTKSSQDVFGLFVTPCWSSEAPAALTALRGRGVTCLAAALYHSRPLDQAPRDCPGGLCAVIGSEGQGLSDAAVAACDMAVRIPMTGLVESLNAGVAGSVLLWHFRGV